VLADKEHRLRRTSDPGCCRAASAGRAPALSSNRGRRVAPFRRQQHRINHQANFRNYLYSDSGDQVAGYFLSYTGLIDWAGKPARFPASLAYTGMLGALSDYRPPPAAYTLAMKLRSLPPGSRRSWRAASVWAASAALVPRFGAVFSGQDGTTWLAVLPVRNCEEITRAFDRSAGYGSGGAAVRV
jgi:hypothetical protein